VAAMTMVMAKAKDEGFKEARREVQGVTASLERRVLAWLCAHMPARVQSDHLTALGLAATIGVGAAYALSAGASFWLHVVNVCLALNWLGDSLDGTLARYRREERPRYGFYVDHIIDALGAVFVFGGLALAGLMSPAVTAVLLIAYLLMAIHVYLATYTAGTFKISYGAVGGTELRLVLMAANLAALRWPRVSAFGFDAPIFDLLGASMALGLAGLLLLCVTRLSMQLRREETRVQNGAA